MRDYGTGISGMANWVYNKIKSFANNIVANIKGALGIHSPSRVFRDEIGKNLGLGVGIGFEDSLNSVYRDMQKAIDMQNAKLTSNLTSQHQINIKNEDNRQATLQSIDDNKETVINNITKLDSKVIARETNKVNTKMKLQYGLS